MKPHTRIPECVDTEGLTWPGERDENLTIQEEGVKPGYYCHPCWLTLIRSCHPKKRVVIRRKRRKR